MPAAEVPQRRGGRRLDAVGPARAHQRYERIDGVRQREGHLVFGVKREFSPRSSGHKQPRLRRSRPRAVALREER